MMVRASSGSRVTTQGSDLRRCASSRAAVTRSAAAVTFLLTSRYTGRRRHHTLSPPLRPAAAGVESSYAAGMSTPEQRPPISPIQWASARDVLPHEALDFTPWLADDLHLLAEVLGLDGLELVATEWRVETFAPDILAQGTDADGDVQVVIETSTDTPTTASSAAPHLRGPRSRGRSPRPGGVAHRGSSAGPPSWRGVP